MQVVKLGHLGNLGAKKWIWPQRLWPMQSAQRGTGGKLGRDACMGSRVVNNRGSEAGTLVHAIAECSSSRLVVAKYIHSTHAIGLSSYVVLVEKEARGRGTRQFCGFSHNTRHVATNTATTWLLGRMRHVSFCRSSLALCSTLFCHSALNGHLLDLAGSSVATTRLDAAEPLGE